MDDCASISLGWRNAIARWQRRSDGAVEMANTVFSYRLSVKQKSVLGSKYWG
jgi:hypothetical protein